MRVLFIAFAVCCNLSLLGSIHGQSPTPIPSPPVTQSPPPAPAGERGPTASIGLDTGASVALPSADGLFSRVAVTTNQLVTAQLQFPADLAGKTVLIQSLDGAQLVATTDKLPAGPNGVVTIQVKLSALEGLHRIAVTCGDSRALLRFYAISPGKAVPDPTLIIPTAAIQ